MRLILSLFAFLASLGFGASLVTHVAGFLGISRPFGFDPWPLHGGIFVVWFPAVFVAIRLTRDFPQKDYWKAALRGCPQWMRHGLYVVGAYAVISFVVFFATTAQLSGAEEEHQVLRGFSGHWLIFYFAAFAILYSAINVGESDPQRRCSNGHPVEPSNTYCSKCGEDVGAVLDEQARYGPE